MPAEKFISNAHPSFISEQYASYQKDRTSVAQDWANFFEGFEFALNGSLVASASSVAPDELKVYSLIYSYRLNGHLLSTTNPIRKRKDRSANLALQDFGLDESSLDQEFEVGRSLGIQQPTLRAIIDFLSKAYCGNIGIEYSYINDREIRYWLRNKIEQKPEDFNFSIEQKKRILKKLNETTVLEKFLGTKYLGEKRFSIEGGESTIPAIDAIINTASQLGVKEVNIGMAHRGRLNVLANILGKTYSQIFSEFEGTTPQQHAFGDGDVKYHLGYSSLVTASGGEQIHLKLVPNPSHLEAVDPVIEGFTRAKGDLVYESDRDQLLPLIIHGDAAVAGQGVVYEVIQMSKLQGYHTGGTIHFIINNQIGFTTDFEDARSTDYCTSIAAAIQAPVFHVNGDDVEAVVFAAQLAAEYRQQFNTDVFIDMVCYRKHGHNEGDDPRFTQPLMYDKINKHQNPRDIYIQKLTGRGELEAELAKKMDKDFWAELQNRLDMVKQKPLPYQYQEPDLAWKALRKSRPKDFEKSPVTAIPKKTIAQIVKGLIKVPEGFTPVRKINKLLERRRKMMREDKTIDWAAAELLAYGSILLEGKNVRMSGQDVKRGTFSHRHAIIYDEKNGSEYNRLNHLAEHQGEFMIYNSLLSEFGVLGFEYGYSLVSPDQLVIWEAQFGDFCNGAQTIIDQFITSSESKWQRMSGLVMLLPHGYEGQGPEHSSARLERFLQACAEHNITVANITSPANFFHLLRRQLKRPFRKPLVVMSPKSLLRHPLCVSSVDEISKGGFKEILHQHQPFDAKKVKRVLCCSGKIYYDLYQYQKTQKIEDVLILRFEQLYPFALTQFNNLKEQFPKAEWLWVQEEPSNMGAWWYINMTTKGAFDDVIARKASASPATGFKKTHQKVQAQIIKTAFGN